MADESVWRRLTRLFRSGPVVRHKIAGGERIPNPQGTAKAFKKELSSLYVRALASYANYERLSRYSDYNEMEYTPELHSALDIYADEATVKNDEGNVIEITSKNAEIKEALETLFFDVIDINFNAWSWMRHFCKFGDFVLFVDANEENGILNLVPIPINEIEREEGYDPKDPMAVRFRWLTRGNTILENWQIIHFRLLGNDSYLPYGSSVLEPARRIWRQLILIEDAMLVYRIVRSPERRVFHIEIANTPPDQVDGFIEQVKTQMKRNTIVDSTTGRVDLRYNPLSVEEDYFLPKRGEQKSQIDTLSGGQFTGDIEDVQYIQSKMFAAIKIPRAYLGYEDQLGSKATLAQEDVRFSKTIERIQGLFVSELNKIAIIHLYLLGYRGADLVNFSIQMANPSTVAAQQRLELWRMKLEVAGMAQEGVFDRVFVYRKIFGLNDKQIAAIKDGKRIDKLEDTLLQSIETPPAAEVPPGPEGAPPEPGAEELPATLGGPPPGGEAPPPSPQVAGRTLGGSVLGEKFNRGSAGSRAEIAVDKGKNLFSTGEDQFKLSFGTKKQTASDPNDRRAARRMVTRPFSEEEDPCMPGEQAIDEVEQMLEAIGTWLSEGTRRDRQISPQELEREIDPEIMAIFDRDVGTRVDTKRTTFYISDIGTIVANVFGGGWWKFVTGGNEPFWSPAEKPGDYRGLAHHMKAQSKGSGYKAQQRRPHEWDSSVCPGCGYAGSGSYPEDCPHCGNGVGLQDGPGMPNSMNFDEPIDWGDD